MQHKMDNDDLEVERGSWMLNVQQSTPFERPTFNIQLPTLNERQKTEHPTFNGHR